jgi:hypothetical protein
MFANGRYDVNDQTPTEIPKHGRIGRPARLRGSPPFGRSLTSSAVLYLKQVEAREAKPFALQRPPISRWRRRRSG